MASLGHGGAGGVCRAAGLMDAACVLGPERALGVAAGHACVPGPVLSALRRSSALTLSHHLREVACPFTEKSNTSEGHRHWAYVPQL